MTGTWRDTLFVWKGELTEKAGTSEFTWEGSWIGCENCPDARTAPTPTKEAFKASAMKFEVAGTGSKNEDTLFYKLELSGGSGWDLGKGDDKKRHTDTKHTLLKNLPSECSGLDMGVVVAIGENEFGSFISAGYLQPTYSELILGRRYLDDCDRRAKWSVEELYERVVATDHGTYNLGSYEMWNDFKAIRRFAPWRTLDLHAECLKGTGGKRKRVDEGRESLEALPALNIPNTDGFSSDLVIDTTDDDATHLTSHVRWLEQCHGCGHGISDPSEACCKEVMEYTREEPNVDVGWTFYCSDECAQKYGAQAWADAGRKWASDMKGTGYFLKSNGESGFWYAVQNDKAAMNVLTDAGWNKDFMAYILYAPSYDGEPVFDESD